MLLWLLLKHHILSSVPVCSLRSQEYIENSIVCIKVLFECLHDNVLTNIRRGLAENKGTWLKALGFVSHAG